MPNRNVHEVMGHLGKDPVASPNATAEELPTGSLRTDTL